MAFDPFGDAATRGYLRNSLGTSDMDVLKRFEHHEFVRKVDKAADQLAQVSKISYADIQQAHKTLFEKVYPWAGEDRSRTAPNVAITKAGKDDMFAHPQEIGRAVDYALKQGQDKAFMAAKPGTVMGSLAHAHPFLDGNGRTIMVVHNELAHRAGISIEWEKTRRDDYLAALTKELDHPGKGHLDAYLKPFVQKVADRETQLQALKELPGLDPKVETAGKPVEAGAGPEAAKPAPADKPRGQRLR